MKTQMVTLLTRPSVEHYIYWNDECLQNDPPLRSFCSVTAIIKAIPLDEKRLQKDRRVSKMVRLYSPLKDIFREIINNL